MKCMIIEDELPAVKVLENYISKFNDLEIVSVYHSAMDAMLELQKNSYDIIFLDIQLPGITGLQMLSSLKQCPKVIITTAHREYAIDGYELEVFDYLLKPIAFERFAKAIAKVYQSSSTLPSAVMPSSIVQEAENKELFSDPFIYVKSEREHVKVFLKDILYVESLRNHVKIYTINECVVSMMSMTHIEEKLPEKYFLRIHRSFLVSLQHITKFNNISICLREKYIPLGRHYKQKFLDWADKNMV